MKRWKTILEEYNYELYYKPGKANVVADALSRLPQINHLANSENNNNSLSETIHSDISSSHHLIPIAQEPINVFKNQIFLKIEETSSYQFQIIFPTYHRHFINETEFNQQNLINLLKRYLNPSVINGLHTDENTLGKIQEIYPIYFSNCRVRFARNIVKDLPNETEQNNEIIKEHKRAHRNGRENKAQILRNFYFPQMQAKIDRIIKQCKICKEQKYERHPTKPLLQSTPIPQYPGQLVHLDIYHTHKKVILTAIDKFSKYAQAKIVNSRATQDIIQPLREILLNYGIPEKIVIDNEKSLGSHPITHLIQDQFNIEVFKALPYTSTVNGQIEKFHSTIGEIMRCIKAEKIHTSFQDLLEKSMHKYNYTIHSTTNQKPAELFFGRRVSTNPLELEKDRNENINRLKAK